MRRIAYGACCRFMMKMIFLDTVDGQLNLPRRSTIASENSACCCVVLNVVMHTE